MESSLEHPLDVHFWGEGAWIGDSAVETSLGYSFGIFLPLLVGRISMSSILLLQIHSLPTILILKCMMFGVFLLVGSTPHPATVTFFPFFNLGATRLPELLHF